MSVIIAPVVSTYYFRFKTQGPQLGVRIYKAYRHCRVGEEKG